nr:MAG TPA: hypothetical protein [Bacteriophage sp.]
MNKFLHKKKTGNCHIPVKKLSQILELLPFYITKPR